DGRKRLPDLQEGFEAHGPTTLKRFEFDEGVETDECRYKIGSMEIRRAEIAANGGGPSHGRICRLACCRHERLKPRNALKAACKPGMGYAAANRNMAVGNIDPVQPG